MGGRSSADAVTRGRRQRGAARLLAAIALATAVAAAAQAPAGGVQADPAATRLAAQARRATERLAALQREADALARTQQTLLDSLRQLEVTRALADARAEQADAVARAAAGELAAADATVARLDAQVAAMVPVVRATVRRLYISGTTDRSTWQVSGGARSDTAGRAIRLLGALAARDRAVIDGYASARATLVRERAGRQARAAAAAVAADAAATARAAAAGAAAAQQARVNQIDRQRDLASRLAGELRQAAERLDREVATLGTGTAAADVALPIRPFRQALPWPVTGEVVRRFGPERSSRFGTRVVRQGIELETRIGTPVTAVHDGRVVFAGPFAGFGQLVIVDHGQAAFSLYGFLDMLQVDRGTMVDRGDELGRSGRSPSGREGTYFELRIDGRPVNPLEWLSRR